MFRLLRKECEKGSVVWYSNVKLLFLSVITDGDPDAVQVVETTDRAAVGELITMKEYVDIIVPRGGKALIERIMQDGTIPMIKPPWDRITAYDMNSGEMLWQKTHSTTPDNIRNNPALASVENRERLGAYGRIFIGTLTTKSLVIAGEGDVHTNADGEVVPLLRAYDKETGPDIEGEVEMPAKQTGSPMTYMHEGKQYIVVQIMGQGHPGALAVLRLPS